MLTGVGVGHTASLLKPDRDWESGIPKGGASTLGREKGCWAGETFNVLTAGLGKWPPQRPLFIPSHFHRSPPNSLPGCVILPHFSLNISTKWSLFFSSKIFVIHHMFYVFVEIMQSVFLKYWNLRMTCM